jgi:hypothetical protein
MLLSSCDVGRSTGALSSPVKVLLLVVYTVAIAAGAFGIGYAVFVSEDSLS